MKKIFSLATAVGISTLGLAGMAQAVAISYSVADINNILIDGSIDNFTTASLATTSTL